MKVLPARMDTHMRVSDLDLLVRRGSWRPGKACTAAKITAPLGSRSRVLGKQSFISVRTNGGVTAAASNSKVYVSTNEGKSWEQIHIPLVSYISSMTLDGKGYVWLNSPQGVFRQVSDGWEKARELPQDKVAVLISIAIPDSRGRDHKGREQSAREQRRA